ncbi:hypothetical protein BBJ28_00006011 [Nothophytophthora sp. Chile5]|nr:hypothetical protein BBJ28_00006011 [Nothophytophthora sp. Chile5]
MKLALSVLLFGHCVAGANVWLYSSGSNAKFALDKAQRCYTFEDQWADRAYRTKWTDLDGASSIAFYQDVECGGESVSKMDRPSGSFSFKKEDKLNLTVSSVMVRQYSVYPVAGLVFIHQEGPDMTEGIDLASNATGSGQ